MKSFSRVPSCIILVLVGVLIASLSGCQFQGVPASSLLTPAAQRTGLEPTVAVIISTPAEQPATEDTAIPAGNPTPVASPSSTFTSAPTRTESSAVGVTPTAQSTTTAAAGPTITTIPTRIPTPLATSSVPLAGFRITRPGQLSRVTSPLQVYGSVIPGADGRVYVDLIGEDGSYLSRQALQFYVEPGFSVLIQPEVTFTVTGAAELARLVIYSLDSAGRTTGLTSQDLILIRIGKDDIYAAGDLLEPLILRLPYPYQEFRGGFVTVTGMARGVNANPLLLELVDASGNVVGSTAIPLAEPLPGSTHAEFSAAVPYTVSSRTPVLLTLRQESDGRIPGTVVLSSQPVTLYP